MASRSVRRRMAAKRRRAEEPGGTTGAAAAAGAPTAGGAAAAAGAPPRRNSSSSHAEAQRPNNNPPAIKRTRDAPREANPAKKARKSVLDGAAAKLQGARFRWLNQQLYETDGAEAFKMFQADPQLFNVYHTGYREQVLKWPINPLDLIISRVRKMPPTAVVADFGCGEARLSASVQQKVHSFDLVAANPRITACDIANVPLENESVDAIVYCLSLMGVNYSKFLTEGCRVLRPGGVAYIAEVKSRFVDDDCKDDGDGPQQLNKDALRQFVALLSSLGLKVSKQDLSNKMFVLFEAKKQDAVTKAPAAASVPAGPKLKACQYKKR